MLKQVGEVWYIYMHYGSDVTCSVTVDSTLCVGYSFPGSGAQNSMKNSLFPGPIQLSFLSCILTLETEQKKAFLCSVERSGMRLSK